MWLVPADDELLTTVDSHLPPGAGSLARLIAAVAAFRDQPFQPCCFDRSNQLGKAGFQLRGVADRLHELRKDVLFEKRPPLAQGLPHHITSSQYEHIEDEEDQRGSR